MTETEIYTQLTEILQDTFMDDDLVATPGLTARDVDGWDSMKQIEIIIAAEERFNTKFSTSEIEQLQCVGDFAGLLMRKVG